MDLSSFSILLSLLEKACLALVLFAIIFHINFFKRTLHGKLNTLDQIILAVIFGIIAIYGTISGVQTTGAIANIRNFGPMMGGLLGGPLVGLGAGLIGGIHRYAVYGGFTALPCALGTILSGLLGGFLYMLCKGKLGIWKPTLFAFVLEIVDMSLILLIARPFSEALKLVSIIAMPMILADTFGIAAFAFLVHDMKNDHKPEA